MPIQLQYNSTLDCIYILFQGQISCDEIILLKDQVINCPDFRENITQIIDCTQGSLDLTTDDLQKIANSYLNSSSSLGLNRKLALIVSQDIDFGKMRQYEAFFEAGPTVKLRTFRSKEEAFKWVQNRPKLDLMSL